MEQKAHEWTSTATTHAKHLAYLATMIAFSLTAVGCDSGSSPKVALPSTAPPAAPSSGAASPTSPTDSVVAAYQALFAAADKAIVSPPEQARAILQAYVAGDYLDWEIRQVMNHQAEHQEPWGKVVVHITKVDLKANTAKIHDCQDASRAGLADSRTHVLIPKTRGTANRNLIANMTRGSDGRWRVTGLRQYDSPCHVSSSPSG
ncbi:hypothetical protein [Actinoallomurus iriomotensis]|uniref:Lipoprotein n=1 Tax=Actinoallomurus iriomotensis TaxID=478107 RepID=A0A9W6S129_9ACTN|nr:hypothetical protein [Actinoallomurus iriomotensis]GLY86025.1 hypothetical protein Airi02_039540 [Actinoallomurus iriomotensis]